MNKLITFSQGPAVTVTLEFAAGLLQTAALSFSDKFQCCLIDGTQDELVSFLEHYGRKESIEIDLPLEDMSPFRQKVLKRLQKVPFGETLTYGQLASAVDQPKAARAIGMACHYNPFPLFIPCHRVVASDGRIGGFAYDIEMKKRLLAFEDSLFN